MKKFNISSHRSANNSTELSLWQIFKRCLVFTLIFCVISLGFTLVISLILFNTKDPSLYVEYAGKGALFFSALLCGLILSRFNGQRYIPAGTILGALITMLIFILYLIFKDNDARDSFIWFMLIPISTLIGSVLGIKRERKNKHKRHR